MIMDSENLTHYLEMCFELDQLLLNESQDILTKYHEQLEGENDIAEILKSLFGVFTVHSFQMNHLGKFDDIEKECLTFKLLKKKGLEAFLRAEIKSMINAIEKKGIED